MGSEAAKGETLVIVERDDDFRIQNDTLLFP